MKKITLDVKNDMDMNNSNIPSINDHASQFMANYAPNPDFVIKYRNNDFLFKMTDQGFKLLSYADILILSTFTTEEHEEFKLLIQKAIENL